MARSIDAHQPDCGCPVCEAGRNGTLVPLSLRVPEGLRDWVRARGGSEFVRSVLEERRAAEG